jgi:hypothetical protein
VDVVIVRAPAATDDPDEILVEQAESLYKVTVAPSSTVKETVGVKLVLLGDAVTILKLENTGPAVSMTIAFWPAILLAPPTAGNVKLALLPAESLIVPVFNANALVLM